MPHATKEARNAYFRDYYREHREVINQRSVSINRQRRHDRYLEIRTLKAGPCADCRGSFPHFVMDFDHRDPSTKVGDISSLVKRMVAWPKVLEEIAKCDLLCTRCHRLRTYQGIRCYKTRLYMYHRAVLDALKEQVPCADCDYRFKACQMDFDHIENKNATVAQLMGTTTEDLLAEIGKCHLVCANCHRVRSHTGVRMKGNLEDLVGVFKEIARGTPFPQDRREAEFAHGHLLGVLPDAEVASLAGISKDMVAWYRRRLGVPAIRSAAPVEVRS